MNNKRYAVIGTFFVLCCACAFLNGMYTRYNSYMRPRYVPLRSNSQSYSVRSGSLLQNQSHSIVAQNESNLWNRFVNRFSSWWKGDEQSELSSVQTQKILLQDSQNDSLIYKKEQLEAKLAGLVEQRKVFLKAAFRGKIGKMNIINQEINKVLHELDFIDKQEKTSAYKNALSLQKQKLSAELNRLYSVVTYEDLDQRLTYESFSPKTTYMSKERKEKAIGEIQKKLNNLSE